MEPITTAALIGAGTSALSSAGSGLFSFLGANKQFKNQKKLNQQAFELNQKSMENAYKMNLEQWNRENEYNSPSAQMARIQAAGLNPNLIYGSTDGGTAASSPNMQAAQYDAPNAPNDLIGVAKAFSSLTDSVSLANQIAQGDFIRAQTDKVLAEKEGVDLENDRRGTFNLYADELYKSSASLATSKIALTNSNKAFLEAGTSLRGKQLEEISQRITESAFRIANLMSETELNKGKLSLIPYQRNAYAASAANSAASANFTSVKSQNYARIVSAELDKTYAQVDVLRQQYETNQITGDLYKSKLKAIKAQTLNNLSKAVQGFYNPLGLTGETGNFFKVMNYSGMLEEIDDLFKDFQ